jgi:hypothetical protein
MPCGKFEASPRRDPQRSQACRSQIVIQDADRRLADHVAGTGHGKCGDWKAAGKRLQQHQTEGVGLARKHENVGSSICLGKGLALPRTWKDSLRVFSSQRSTCGSIADDQLGAW